jgi:hypothetical protein
MLRLSWYFLMEVVYNEDLYSKEKDTSQLIKRGFRDFKLQKWNSYEKFESNLNEATNYGQEQVGLID